jgi:serine/threonine-protein kinase
MGAVWRAHDLDLKAPVAVKLLDPLIAASTEGLGRFHREAEAAATLRSPHVVQIMARGVDEATHQPYIVMELMEGESLATRLERLGTLTPAQTARILTQVARALGRAHDAGIVHRDLKPDNIFLVPNDDDEVAKVLDFGIAKSDRHRLGGGTDTRTGAVMGTPYYMSPEQISSSKGVDFRADLWAFGVIACECLTGRRPFEDETYGGLAVKICALPIPRASSVGAVPPAFDAWFARAVERDPQARFASAREAADELRRVCGEAVTSSPPVADAPKPLGLAHPISTAALSRTAHGEAANRPSPIGWVLGGGALLVAAAAGVAFWLSRPDALPEPAASISAAASPSVVSPAPPAPPPAPPPALAVPQVTAAAPEPAIAKAKVATPSPTPSAKRASTKGPAGVTSAAAVAVAKAPATATTTVAKAVQPATTKPKVPPASSPTGTRH